MRLVVFAGVMVVLLAIAAVGIGLRLTGGLNGYLADSNAPLKTVPQASAPPSSNGQSGQSGQALDLQTVAGKIDPVLVDVNTVVQEGVDGQTAQAAGTGIIVTSGGEVLTNNHVIQGSTSIDVTLPGETTTHSATVIGADPTDDVALIQVHGVSGLPTASLADSSALKVGQDVAAIGNALGQGGTPPATQGQITALDQSITVSDDSGGTEDLSGLIQMDASIQPGDSGGAVANGAGQVVGMITAAETDGRSQDSASTVGYAIPINQAVGIANQIRAGHETSKIIIGQAGYMGVEVQDLSPNAAERLGLDVTSGAYVAGVASGGPADQAGIEQGAVITAVNGQTITSSGDLGPAIQSHDPGQQIQVTWVDQTGTHTGSVTLASGPAV
jgi:S1-C subfamily serine protease